LVIGVLGDVCDAVEGFGLFRYLPFCRVLIDGRSTRIGHGAEAALAVCAGIVGIDDVNIGRKVDLGEAVQGVVEVADRHPFGVGLACEVACGIVGIGLGAGVWRDDLVDPSFVVVLVSSRVGVGVLNGGEVVVGVVAVLGDDRAGLDDLCLVNIFTFKSDPLRSSNACEVHDPMRSIVGCPQSNPL